MTRTSRSTSSTAAALLDEWSALKAVDQHCHPLRRWPFTVTALDLRAAFTEAVDPAQIGEHVIHTAAYRGALHRLADRLGCDPEEAVVLERRNRLDPQSHARQLLEGTGMMLVDTGFATADSFTIREQSEALAIPQREVVRLETLAERLVAGAADAHDWLAGVGAALERAFADGVVGVKTICAYRASLELTVPDDGDVTHAFQALKREGDGGHHARLSGNPLCHALLLHAARLCAQHGIPLQVHCGFGDPDEDLAQTSPLGLRRLFVDSAFSGLKVVLLHCYPYHREAAYLCSVFPGVYMDLSLAIPLAARDGQRAIQEALGLCPLSKLVYASDASRYPEVFFVAAAWHREALAEALVGLIDGGFLTVAQAIDAGRRVLADNAGRVYGLPI